jgi:AraC-like DNA-binding protein
MLHSTWVVVSSGFVEDVAADTPVWRAPFGQPFTQPPLSLLAELHRFLRRATVSADALSAQEELTVLLPKLLTAGGDMPAMTARRGMEKLARSADDLLDQEFAQIGSLAQLARRLGVSASYLTRAYRAVTGGTLHAKVTRLRLSHALARLADGAKDLTALALELGYASHSHFSAEFKRHIGHPPSAFRLSTQM